MVSEHQARLGGNWERAVFSRADTLDVLAKEWPRELARYAWAASQIQPGMSVLEVGCSSGWGTTVFPAGITYTGVDADRDIIAYASVEFAAPGRTFIWSTINAFLDTLGDRTFDVIVCMEVLEHITDGKEIFQRLKQCGRTVLATVPYREPVGFWGPHHVLHGLKESDFPQASYRFLQPGEIIDASPTQEPTNLMLLEWHADQAYTDKPRVLCSIPTRERYDVLMLCLQAVACQQTPPDKVIIYDDTPAETRQDIRTDPIGRYVLPLLNRFGIEWEVVFTPGKGQHIAHQMANDSGYDFVWRLDDDTIPEPDVLRRLLAYMTEGVGAVGGAVYEMGAVSVGHATTMAQFFTDCTTQWAPDHGTYEVEFIYSSFLYRAGIVDYKHNMSPAAFHEETIFTHRLFRAGYRLIVDTSIKTHHYKAPRGGTRYTDLKWAYAWDQAEFMRVLEQEWGIKLIELNVGLGDNYAFCQIVPDLLAKYQQVVVATCYPEVFADSGVTAVHIGRGASVVGSDNIYDFMSERGWKRTMVEAMREAYL
jgi:GT2 family glycosyltransferase